MADASKAFGAPTILSNVVLIVEGKKLHVNKELLSYWSPAFEAIFFGDFAEKDKQEVEITHVGYEEFVNLLKLIHPDWTPSTDSSIAHTMKLFDQFEIKAVERPLRSSAAHAAAAAPATVGGSTPRFRVPPIMTKVEGKDNGLKTVITNMSDIAKAPGRPPSHFIKVRAPVARRPIAVQKNGRPFDDFAEIKQDKSVFNDAFLAGHGQREPGRSREWGNWSDGDEPNNRSNVILKIGEKNVHASKEFLASHSPVFKALFFGEYAENGKEEVEIKDIVYDEFVDFLHLLSSVMIDMTDRQVSHVLKLAVRFKVENLMKESEKHLIQSKGIKVAKKLLLADQYRLTSLKDHCLNSFVSVAKLWAKLKSSPEYTNFSAELKVSICDRCMELSNQ